MPLYLPFPVTRFARANGMEQVEYVILDLTPVPHVDSMGCHFLEDLNEVRPNKIFAHVCLLVFAHTTVPCLVGVCGCHTAGTCSLSCHRAGQAFSPAAVQLSSHVHMMPCTQPCGTRASPWPPGPTAWPASTIYGNIYFQRIPNIMKCTSNITNCTSNITFKHYQVYFKHYQLCI
jgi:hypothetical protein